MKTNLTNPEFQNAFLVVIQKGETEIKKLITYYALNYKSKIELRNRIDGIILAVAKRLPADLIDKESYINGLKNSSEKMIKEFYDTMIAKFVFYSLILANVSIKVSTPLELIKEIKSNPLKIEKLIPRETWSKAKGYPYITNYYKEVKSRLNLLAETETRSSEAGKKGISLWQKAEIDIRHEHQLKMVQDLKDSGVKYAWTSSHPDCSKRCEKWQGKLFDLNNHAELSGFRMRKKIDGHTVYSFTDVVSQVDKYGYKNNIIVGFNCRHHLIPFESGSVPPEEFTKEEIQREREVNSTLREYERKIRLLKQKIILDNSISKEEVATLKAKLKELISAYKAFANKNGYAWYQERI